MGAIISFIAARLPLFRVLGSLALFAVWTVFIYIKTSEMEKGQQAKQILREVDKHEQIQRKIDGLSCPVVDKQLHQWMR